jgi:hypothetical protein
MEIPLGLVVKAMLVVFIAADEKLRISCQPFPISDHDLSVAPQTLQI